jgi:hypothetical protein
MLAGYEQPPGQPVGERQPGDEEERRRGPDPLGEATTQGWAEEGPDAERRKGDAHRLAARVGLVRRGDQRETRRPAGAGGCALQRASADKQHGIAYEGEQDGGRRQTKQADQHGRAGAVPILPEPARGVAAIKPAA